MVFKPKQLQKGDQVAIVSLSSGILGEKFCQHQLKLGIKRLEEFGLVPVFMPNALKGVEFISKHPAARAQDLKDAFANPAIKAIICAIGGFETYKTLPSLLTDSEFKQNVQQNPKIFIGYSDTTINHWMFHQLGMNTFYGHAFLVDFAELDQQMLPYSKASFTELFENPETREIKSSEFWYEERTDFSLNAVNTSRIKHPETHGYEVLRGQGTITGRLFGGCLESIYAGLEKNNILDQNQVWAEYGIFPAAQDWKDKILFLETSEEQPTPEAYQIMIETLDQQGIFQLVKGLMVGKPQNEKYYEEYKKILIKITAKNNLPIIYNVNFGHAYPKTIIPYNLLTKIDLDQKKIIISETFFA